MSNVMCEVQGVKCKVQSGVEWRVRSANCKCEESSVKCEVQSVNCTV